MKACFKFLIDSRFLIILSICYDLYLLIFSIVKRQYEYLGIAITLLINSILILKKQRKEESASAKLKF